MNLKKYILGSFSLHLYSKLELFYEIQFDNQVVESLEQNHCRLKGGGAIIPSSLAVALG